MYLPEDNVRTGNKGKISSVLVFILLLIMIIGIAALVYLKSQNFDFKSINIQDVFKEGIQLKMQEEAKPKETEIPSADKEKHAFTTYKDVLIKCTSDNVRGIDKSGNELWSISIAMSNPKVKKSDNDLLVYDLGGRDVMVINGKTVKWSKKIGNNIINADISKSGHVSVIHELKGYKGAVVVFNLQGNEFFTRSYADNFVFKAAVSPGGKYVVVNSLDTSGAQASSFIEFMDMLGTKLAGRVLEEEKVFPLIQFIREDILAAVNESSIICFDRSSKEQKEKWKKEYKDRVVYSSGTASGKYLFAAVSGEDRQGVFNTSSTDIKILNAEGKETAQYTVRGKVLNISVNGDIAAVNAGREIFFINTRGKLVGKYTSKVDVSEVHFFNKQEIVVVSKSNVVITKYQ